MPQIRVLPRHLVNKIAAGEVVERPASVVKELVENALDAGATHVDITIEDGGRRLISVRDDGAGMGADDLALAFAPHATSKIAGEDDLFNIRTMGFRGEALASVAAVSQAHILTRRRGGDERAGCEIRCEGGSIEPVRPAAAPEGTTVTVGNLFFNTPARRKFLRTAETEFGHVVEQVWRLAIPNCGVGFSLAHNRRQVMRLSPGQPLRSRIEGVYGRAVGEGLIEFASAEGGVSVRGLLGSPTAARATGRYQYFFVNGRYVRDRLLGHALREAYRGLIEPSRSPVAFAFVEVAPGEVDVNVHPTKIEVRFRNGQAVHSELLAAMREALNRLDLAPSVQVPDGSDREEASLDQRRQSLRQALADFFKSGPRPGPRLDFPSDRTGDSFGGATATPAPSGGSGAAAPAVPEIAPPSAQPAPRDDRRPAEARADWAASWPVPSAVPAMQVHDTYIVAATPEGLSIIDQHALHERILFQDLLDRVAQGPLASQRLLIPETVDATESDKAALTERSELLNRLGVEVTEFGPRTLAVQRFPVLLAERQVPPAQFLRDLLDVLAEHARADGEELLGHVLSTMACNAAVKAGQRLGAEEIQALLARRQQIERGLSCPHGRPTALTLNLQDLEKQFKRT